VIGIERLLKALVDSEANFIVVGAYAAIMHGSTLRTDDLDICYERTPGNYKRIIKAVRGFHPRLRDMPGDVKAPFDEPSLAQGRCFSIGALCERYELRSHPYVSWPNANGIQRDVRP